MNIAEITVRETSTEMHPYANQFSDDDLNNACNNCENAPERDDMDNGCFICAMIPPKTINTEKSIDIPFILVFFISIIIFLSILIIFRFKKYGS